MIVSTSSSAAEPLRLLELPSRPLRADEVRVRVRAIGVNPVDWKMRSGGPLRMAHRLLGPSGPLVVGVDFAGDVTEVGARAEGLSMGQRVVGGTNFARSQLGSYASEVVVRPDQCAALPDTVSFDDAACLPVAAVTPWRALTELAGLPAKKGVAVLVLGASGGVGLFALQLARALGVRAMGVCSTRNVAVVERFGATALDYTAGDVIQAAKAAGPYDLVLNAVGSAMYPAAKCLELLKPDGALGLVVVDPADVPYVAFSRKTHHVFGRPTRDQLEPLVAMLARGELEPVIEARFKLEQAEEAHVRSRAGKVVGKLLLNP